MTLLFDESNASKDHLRLSYYFFLMKKKKGNPKLNISKDVAKKGTKNYLKNANCISFPIENYICESSKETK